MENSLFEMNLEKSKLLEEELIKNFPTEKKGLVVVIPLYGFEKWIIYWDFLFDIQDNKRISAQFFEPVSLYLLNQLPYESWPFWLDYLKAKTSLFHPIKITDYLITYLENPRILSGHSAITSTDPSTKENHVSDIIILKDKLKLESINEADM